MMYACCLESVGFFFFNDPATTEIYPLSLHDALPISARASCRCVAWCCSSAGGSAATAASSRRSSSIAGARSRRRRKSASSGRSEEHTSELQSHSDLVCRLLLEKKKYRGLHCTIQADI